MKMKMKMKNRSHRHGINRPRLRQDTKIVNIGSVSHMMMLICIKQQLNKICSLIHEKVEQH